MYCIGGIYSHETFYDKLRDVIWIFGGRDLADRELTEVSIYNYTSNTFEDQPALPALPASTSNNANHLAVLNDVAYLLKSGGSELISYSLSKVQHFF